MRKVYWRLIPLLFLMVFINYLDRQNIGYAQLDMGKQLGITDSWAQGRRDGRREGNRRRALVADHSGRRSVPRVGIDADHHAEDSARAP